MTTRAPPSRRRVVVSDLAAGFAANATNYVRASCLRPQPPRRARRRPSRAQPAAAPHITASDQSEPTRRPAELHRAARNSSFLIAPPASPSVRRSMSASHACCRSRRAERADAPSSSACCCSSHHSARSIRADTMATRAPPSCEDFVVPNCAAGFAAFAPIYVRASRVRPQPSRRARRRPSREQPAAAPRITAPQLEPSRRPRGRHRAAGESSFLIVPPDWPRMRRTMSAPRACGRSRRAGRADAPLEFSPLLLLLSPRQIDRSRQDGHESVAEPR